MQPPLPTGICTILSLFLVKNSFTLPRAKRFLSNFISIMASSLFILMLQTSYKLNR